MTLPKAELSRRKVEEAFKRMRAALDIANENATIIETELGGVNPSPSQSFTGLTEQQLAAELAKSRARRNIPPFQSK